jgi:DNA-binding phage protein
MKSLLCIVLEAVEIMNSKPYNKLEGLDDPENAAKYLRVALEEGNKKHIAIALRNIAEANKVNLYSSSGEP